MVAYLLLILNNMKKTLLALVVLVGLAFSAHAQVPGEGGSGVRVGAGFGVGVTVGPHATDYPAAGQINLHLEIPVGEDMPLSILLKTGYTFYVSKDGYSYNSRYGTTGSIVSFVPAQVGVRVYVGKLFFQGDVGASFNLNSSTSTYTGKKTALLVSPGIGYGFRFGDSDKFGVDLSLAYESRLEKTQSVTYEDEFGNTVTGTGYGNYNQVAFHVAFSLGL